MKPSAVSVGIEKLETSRSDPNHNVLPISLCAGKVVRLRQQLMGAADAVKGLFGQKKQQDQAVEKLEALRVSLSSELKLQLSNEALQKMAGAEEHIQCAEFADGMSVHLIAGKDRGGQATIQR